MERLIVLVTLLAILAGLLLLGIVDTSASIADASIPDEIVSNVNQTGNSDTASAIITIIMRTAPLPDE